MEQSQNSVPCERLPLADTALRPEPFTASVTELVFVLPYFMMFMIYSPSRSRSSIGSAVMKHSGSPVTSSMTGRSPQRVQRVMQSDTAI